MLCPDLPADTQKVREAQRHVDLDSWASGILRGLQEGLMSRIL